MSSTSSSYDTLATAAILAASAGLISLVALQSDRFSRWWLSADRLQVKRHAEYRYTWQQALERLSIQLQYSWAGAGSAVGAGTQTSCDKDEEELLQTTVCQTDAEIADIVDKLLSKKINPKDILIGKIAKDDTKLPGSSEYYVWLYHLNKGGGSNNDNNNNVFCPMYQLPVTKFGMALAEKLEDRVSSTTFCFVADASAGQASDMIAEMVEAATKKTTVFIVPEPAWMVYLAAWFQEQHLLDSTTTVQRILLALCRLEALRVTSKEQRTVLITVPQSTVPILLPLLQQVFPDDRHVFAYSSCLAAVGAAEARRQQYRRGHIPATLQQAIEFNTNPVTVAIPILKSSLHLQTPFIGSSFKKEMSPFCQAMAALPVNLAGTVESWMAATDAMLKLKEDERTTGYLPYVMKYEYFTGFFSDSYNPIVELSSVSNSKKQSDLYWIVRSLLQYITGSRSRPLPEEVLEASLSWLRDYNINRQQQQQVLKNSELFLAAIQDVVFTHKRILLQNKTLLDSVQPAEHWTLKHAMKNGCACCEPEDEDEDEEEERLANEKRNNVGLSFFELGRGDGANDAGSRPAASTNNKYVDGKLGFAFDPTKFS